MNENGNVCLTIGSGSCVHVKVNQDEGDVDHCMVYYSFISLMPAIRKGGAVDGRRSLQSNPLNHIRHIL